MNCNFCLNSNCSCCSNHYKTTSVTVVGTTLVLALPAQALANCQTMCIKIEQPIPANAGTNNVVIKIGSTSYTAITPCCANNLYADQLQNNKIYCFKFATDTNCLIYRGGWRLCKTSKVFNIIPTPAI